MERLWQRNRSFLVFVLILVSVRSVVADHYFVPSGSMLPTLEIGDQIFVDKSAYHFRIPFTHLVLMNIDEPQRGDVVVFEHPMSSETLVKRLIGLPGDRIEIFGGNVFVNGLPEEDFYEEKFKGPSIPLVGIKTYKVPKDHYFFLGDNRTNSSDSRVWGFVPRRNLLGKAKNILYSRNGFKLKWGRVGLGL